MKLFGFAARMFLCIFFGLIDVRIQANEMFSMPSTDKIFQEPRGCVQAQIFPCSIQTPKNKKFIWKLENIQIVASGETTLMIKAYNILHVIKGHLWARTEAPIEISSAFGTFHMNSGDALFQRNPKTFHVTPLIGDIQLTRWGTKEKLLIPQGFTNWVGPVDQSGDSSVGVPSAASLFDTMRSWARLYTEGFSKFEQDIALYRNSWEHAVHQASDLHKELYDRRVASIKAEEARRARQRARWESERKKMRDIFWKKHLE